MKAKPPSPRGIWLAIIKQLKDELATQLEANRLMEEKWDVGFDTNVKIIEKLNHDLKELRAEYNSEWRKAINATPEVKRLNGELDAFRDVVKSLKAKLATAEGAIRRAEDRRDVAESKLWAYHEEVKRAQAHQNEILSRPTLIPVKAP